MPSRRRFTANRRRVTRVLDSCKIRKLRPVERRTDTVARPADLSVIQQLLTVIGDNRALAVEGRDPAELGLDPPRTVLEIVELVGDQELRHRLELGVVEDQYGAGRGQAAPAGYSRIMFKHAGIVAIKPRKI